jgi:hypothetical protein
MQPEEWRYVFTDLEAELIERVLELLTYMTPGAHKNGLPTHPARKAADVLHKLGVEVP